MRGFWVAVFVIAAFVIGGLLGTRTDTFSQVGDQLFGADQGNVSSEALEIIEDRYFQDVDAEELDEASVSAIVNQLRKRYDDRFSHYFGPKAYHRFQEVLSREYSGVGLSVIEAKRGLRVAMVFGGSPASRAGIKEGDVVTAVDGRSIAGEDSELATAEIKGRPGTKVTLTVVRPSTGAEREVELTRKRLRVPEVDGRLRRVDGVPIGYVRLLGFSQGAHAELRREVERLDEQGAEGLVLDLRGNGGGLLTEAVLTSSVFVEEGVIVSTSRRSGGDDSYEAVGDALPERPMVVLIDGDTASAAEILASALADADLAEVVGQTSFGKGTFQEVIPLDNGGALDLTVGEYLTRGGESLAGSGIDPDVPARDKPATPRDEALSRALSIVADRLEPPVNASSGKQPAGG